MSYDFCLFQLQPGQDPVEKYMSLDDEEKVIPPEPQKELRKKKVAEALVSHDPSLNIFGFDYSEISKVTHLSEEEAKLKYRNIEVNTPDDGPGIQIELNDDHFSLTVPYWHTGGKAGEVFTHIWQYLEIMQNETGFVVFDPQLGKVLNLSDGYEQAVNIYGNVLTTVNNSIAKRILPAPVKKAKKWWQFKLWD